MKKKILFWIINYPNSLGEITNACLFAEEIKEKYDIYFLDSNELVRSYLINYEFKTTNLNDIEKDIFDIVIFSEYTNLFNQKFEKDTFDLYIKKIDLLVTKKTVFLSIDVLGLGSSSEEINENLKKSSELSNLYNNVIVPPNYYSIKPYPINDYQTNLKNSFMWGINKIPKNEKIIKRAKIILECKDETKTMFLPISKWKYFQWKENSPELYDRLAKSLLNKLSKLNYQNETNFYFGTPNYNYKKIREGNLNFFIFDPKSEDYLKPQIYEQFLINSDIVLTINIILNSFIRALNQGVSCINLTNNVYQENINLPIDDFMKETVLNNFYTLNKFPFEETNLFSKRFSTFEIFDKNLYKKIEQILNNHKKIKKENKLAISANEITKKVII